MQPEGSQGPLTVSCYCPGKPHTGECRLLRYADRKRAKIAQDVQTPRARNSDPETSHAAALSVRNLVERHYAVLEAFRSWGPMTDEDLVARYHGVPTALRSTDSSIRTRRKELAVMGRLVEVGLRKLQSGRNGRIWALAKEGE